MDEMESTVAEPETVETEGPSAEESLNAELDEIYASHTDEGDATQTVAPEKVGTPEQARPEPEAQAIPAPATWGKNSQELFNQLPRELKEQVAKRETEREQVLGRAFNAMQMMQNMQPVMQGFKELQPYFQAFRGSDGNPLWGNPQAMMKEISDVLNVKSLIMRDPQAGLQAVLSWAQAAGLNLAPSEDGQQVDPQVMALRQRLAQLEQDNQRRDASERERQANAQRQEAIVSVANGLNDFAQAKNEAGEPLYPHLFGDHGAQVGELMGRWMRANAGQDGITPELFKSAYEAAIFSVAETREAEFKARENARIKQFQQNSARARKAAGINPRPGKAPEVDPKKPIEEIYEEIWAKHNT